MVSECSRHCYAGFFLIISGINESFSGYFRMDGHCTSSRPCAYGQGDCDHDYHCKKGLICASKADNCRNFDRNADANADCCGKYCLLLLMIL